MKLALGTVQFGLKYGISNQTGTVAAGEVSEILKLAKAGGIDVLDTAPAYGDSEKVLGAAEAPHHFRIVTKTPHLSKQKEANVEKAFESSLLALKTSSVYGILVHAFEDIQSEASAGVVLGQLEKLKAAGKVQKLGISVYHPEQAKFIIDRFAIDLIQLPLNLFSQKFLTSGMLEELAKKKIEIHVRSAFLQGIALMEGAKIPAYFEPVKEKLQAFHRLSEESGLSREALALGFLKNQPAISKILVGVESSAQLKKNFEAYAQVTDKLNFSEFDFKDERFENPSLWKC